MYIVSGAFAHLLQNLLQNLVFLSIMLISALFLFKFGTDIAYLLLKYTASLYIKGNKMYRQYKQYANGNLYLVGKEGDIYVYNYTCDKLKLHTLIFKEHEHTLAFLENPSKYIEHANDFLYVQVIRPLEKESKESHESDGIDVIDITEHIKHFNFYNINNNQVMYKDIIEYALGVPVSSIHPESMINVFYSDGEEKTVNIKDFT
jgi:hypothetical protein